MCAGSSRDTTSALIEKRKIPNLILADGPAGLRLQTHFKTDKEGNKLPGGEQFGMEIAPFAKEQPEGAQDYYQYCTAIPIATTLAQSWDVDLIKRMGEIVGEEMEQFHIHLWLAPGIPDCVRQPIQRVYSLTKDMERRSSILRQIIRKTTVCSRTHISANVH